MSLQGPFKVFIFKLGVDSTKSLHVPPLIFMNIKSQHIVLTVFVRLHLNRRDKNIVSLSNAQRNTPSVLRVTCFQRPT